MCWLIVLNKFKTHGLFFLHNGIPIQGLDHGVPDKYIYCRSLSKGYHSSRILAGTRTRYFDASLTFSSWVLPRQARQTSTTDSYSIHNTLKPKKKNPTGFLRNCSVSYCKKSVQVLSANLSQIKQNMF